MNYVFLLSEGKKEEFSGMLRTVQSLHDWYLKYVEDSEHYKNHTNYSISLGKKFHIIQAHLASFIQRNQRSLGVFSEQTSESAHKNINKTMKRQHQNLLKHTDKN